MKRSLMETAAFPRDARQTADDAVLQTAMASTRLVLNEVEAARAVGISPRSLQRMRMDGDGPPYVQLSPRRIGYAVGELHEWLRARARRSTSDSAGSAAP